MISTNNGWSKNDTEWFRKEINLIKRMHTGWDMSKEVIDAYCENLKGCDFDVIKSIVKLSWSRKEFPLIGDIKEEYFRIKKSSSGFDFNFSKRIEHSNQENGCGEKNYNVVMSMMYLYYMHGWIGNIESSEAVMNYFGMLYPGEDFDFEKLKCVLNEEVVGCYVRENIMI